MTAEELLEQVLPAWRAELPREQAEQLDAFLEQPRFRRRVPGLLAKYLSGTVPVVSRRSAAPRPMTLAELARPPGGLRTRPANSCQPRGCRTPKPASRCRW